MTRTDPDAPGLPLCPRCGKQDRLDRDESNFAPGCADPGDPLTHYWCRRCGAWLSYLRDEAALDAGAKPAEVPPVPAKKARKKKGESP